MDDHSIVNLYLKRDESAVKETQNKYGTYCYAIASNVLHVHEDAEECVNDTWVSAWNKIPPVVPKSLKAFLGKLVRDISLSRYRACHAQKRFSGMEVLLDELEECIPSGLDLQKELEQQELPGLIDMWLESLSQVDRVLFIKRYYYGESVKKLAKLQGWTQNQTAQRMLKLRKGLKTFLISNGVLV